MQRANHSLKFGTKKLLRSIKRLAMTSANRLGVSRAIGASRWRQQRLLILCYHGISQDDEHEWSDLYVSPQHFEQRLDILHDTANVIQFDTAITQLYDGELPPRSATITFDDGMCDFATVATPILQRASMHSTV
jgi:hypothetical protein